MSAVKRGFLATESDIMETRIANVRATIGPKLQSFRAGGDERDIAIAYAALEELASFDASLGWKEFLRDALTEVLWSPR